MSFIHLEKSVLTFHFKEILEDGQGNHPIAWLGLGVLALGPQALPNLAKVSQPITKKLIKRSPGVTVTKPIPLSQWVAEAEKRELTRSE